MLRLPNRLNLDYIPIGTEDVLNVPLSQNGEIHVHKKIDRTTPVDMAQFTVYSALESDSRRLRIAGDLPLQLLNGGMMDADHQSHRGFDKPQEFVEVLQVEPGDWRVDVQEGSVACQDTVESFISVVSMNVIRHLYQQGKINL